jgi:hypothetical protein
LKASSAMAKRIQPRLNRKRGGCCPVGDDPRGAGGGRASLGVSAGCPFAGARSRSWLAIKDDARHVGTPSGSQRQMEFDTKIAVVLRDDLAVWQKTNVTAFLVSGIAGTVPDVVGDPYRDASGNEYLPMFVQPVLVYEADTGGLRRAYERAMDRGVTPAIYTAKLFATDHDEANRAAVAGVRAEELDLVGIAFRAERKTVDKVVDRLRFHP